VNTLPPYQDRHGHAWIGSYDTDEEEAIRDTASEQQDTRRRKLSKWARDAGRRRHITRALRQSGYQIKEIARLLDVSTATVWRDLQ
jgi:transcriptional regulator with PAS, ATPase and Fis domain